MRGAKLPLFLNSSDPPKKKGKKKDHEKSWRVKLKAERAAPVQSLGNFFQQKPDRVCEQAKCQFMQPDLLFSIDLQGRLDVLVKSHLGF